MTYDDSDIETQAVKNHAKRQAMKRNGVKLTDRDLELMVAMIKAGQATFVKRRDKDPEWRSIYEIDWHGRKLLVVYNENFESIQTILPDYQQQVDERWLPLAKLRKEIR